MKLLFAEVQRFRSNWLLLFFIPINGLFIYAIVKQVIFGQDWGSKPAPNWLLFLIEGFILIFTFWFWNIKLITEVHPNYLKFKFHSMMLGFKTIRYEEIENFRLKKYDAIMEYGGWGIKGKRHKKAYTVSGNYGIQFLLKNGKMIMIGTQKPKGFAKAIKDKIHQIEN